MKAAERGKISKRGKGRGSSCGDVTGREDVIGLTLLLSPFGINHHFESTFPPF